MSVFYKNRVLFVIFLLVVTVVGFAVAGIYFYTDVLILKNKTRITNYLSDKSLAQISFSKLQGNFANGFNIVNLQGSSSSGEIFRLDSVYINIDPFKLLLGEINIRDLLINSAAIDIDKISDLEKLFPSRGKNNQQQRYLKILRCRVKDLELHHDNENSKISSEFQLISAKDQIRLLLNNLKFDRENLKGSFDSVRVTINNHIMTTDSFKYTFITQDTISGTAAVTLETNQWRYPVDFSLDGSVKTKILHIDELELAGVVFSDKIKLQRGNAKIDQSVIDLSGRYSFPDKNWNLDLTFDEFMTKLDSISMVVSGKVDATGTINTDSIGVVADIDYLNYGKLEIENIKGNLSYKDTVLINNQSIEFSLPGAIGLIDTFYVKKDEYKISGQVALKEFSPGKYFSGLPAVNVSGIGSFGLFNRNGNADIRSKLFLKPISYKKLSFGDSYWEASVNSENGKLSDLKLIGNAKSMDFPLITLDQTVINAHYHKGEIKLDHIYGYNDNGDYVFISGFTDSTISNIVLDSLFLNLNGVKSHSGRLDITNDDDIYYITCDSLFLNSGNISLNGKYANREKFEFDLSITNVNISDIVDMIRINSSVSGIIYGNSQISKWDSKPVFFSDFRIVDGQIGELQMNSLQGNFSYYNHRLIVGKISADLELGTAELTGWVNSSIDSGNTFTITPQDSLDIRAEVNDIQIGSFQRYIPWKFKTTGKVSGNVGITGTFSDIYMDSDLQVKDPVFDRIKGEFAKGKLIYSNKKLFFKNTEINLSHGNYSVSGFIPVDLDYFSDNRSRVFQNPIDLMVNGKATEIEFFYPYFDITDSLKCDCSMQLSLDGTFKSPVRNGQLVIEKGKVSISKLNNSFTDITGLVTVDNNQMKIIKLEGKSIKTEKEDILNTPLDYLSKLFHPSKKTGAKTSNINIQGTVDLRSFFKPYFNLSATGKHIYLEDADNEFFGTGLTDITVEGRDTILVTGTFEPDPYEFTINPVLSGETEINKTYNQDGKLIIYDIHIPLENGVIIKNEFMNIEIEGEITLTASGDENFILSGNVNIVNGSFYLNGNEFTDTEGRILFDPASDYPEIDIFAYTYINGMSYKVLFSGPLNNPVLGFESEDPADTYSQDDILRILLAGDESLIAGKNFKIQDAGTNIISNYLENELERLITQKSPVDQFQLKSQGALLKDINNMDINLYMGKRMSRKLYMNIKSDIFSNQIKNEYEIIYRVDKNQSVVVRLDDDGFPHFNYRIKFKY